MAVDSMMIVSVIVVAFLIFMGVLAATAWYDQGARGRGGK